MRNGRGKTVLGSGLLFVALVSVIVLPGVRQLQAFNAVKAGAPAEELAQHVSVALYLTAAGILVLPVALVLLIVGVVQLQSRAQ